MKYVLIPLLFAIPALLVAFPIKRETYIEKWAKEQPGVTKIETFKAITICQKFTVTKIKSCDKYWCWGNAENAFGENTFQKLNPHTKNGARVITCTVLNAENGSNVDNYPLWSEFPQW